MEVTDSCPWGTLPTELVARIAHNLPPNEVACNFRLVNKSTGTHLKGWILVRLSQPVPHHAFARRWGDERGVHGFTLGRRQQLLCLTARSCVIANLEVAVAAVGCPLTDQVFNAAAEEGQVVVCVWLLDRGCPLNTEEAIRCAVRAGHTAVVRWLLAQFPQHTGVALAEAASTGQQVLCEELLAAEDGLESIGVAACEAAKGGHVELTERLLGQLPRPSYLTDRELLRFAAYGFELPALQRLFHSRLGSEVPAPVRFRLVHGANLAAAALTSRTPDWRAKLEWLEAVGCRLEEDQRWSDITKREDAVERVALLRERGLLDAGDCARFAVATSNLTVVQYLRSEGLLTGAVGTRAMVEAVKVGDLAVMAELVGAGVTVRPNEVYTAASRGHLHVLRWLEGPEAGPEAAVALRGALQNAALTAFSVRSDSLELMEWLWERGCPSDERVFSAAVGAGSVALLERLVARGCPVSCDAYSKPFHNGDMATLRCLRRLGCSWGADCNIFNSAMLSNCSLDVLRWLVAEGCTVDWRRARERVHVDRRGAAEVLAWIESHIPRRA